MTPRHRVSKAAITLIQRFEGYRRQAAQLPDGRWTIGYGHTQSARRGAEVSLDDAEALLTYDLIAVTKALDEHVYAPLNQNQIDALAAFAYNIGIDNFRSSAVLKRINEGAPIQAVWAMELWRKAEFQGERIVIDALVRRRACEKLLFLTPPGEAWTPAPSTILRPVLDTDAPDMAPRQTPTNLSASLDGETVQVTRDGAPVASLMPATPEGAGPASVAAEAVTARLQTIFAEPEAPPVVSPEAPRPQADFAAPIHIAGEEPFALVSPLEDEDWDGPQDDIEDADPEDPSRRDLFDDAAGDNDRAGDLDAADAAPRLMIDDAAPFDFGTAHPRPLPEQPKGGFLSLVALAAIGLAFFAGGVFWATNARANLESTLLSPTTVGWLAGLAGVIFFAVAVFLLLQRLGQSAEHAARTRHR